MKTLLTVFAACLFASGAFAQTQQTGFPPFGTFQNGRFDSVNLQNLNVNFSLPVVSVPGRGQNFSPYISSNSLMWVPQFIQGFGTNWTPTVDPWGIVNWGWKLSGFSGLLVWSSQSYTCSSDHQQTIHYWNFNVEESTGTIHPFPINYYTVRTNCGYITTPTTGVAADFSGWYVNANPSLQFDAYSPGGTSMPAEKFTDSNGNYMTETGVPPGPSETYTDTLNRTALVITKSGDTWTYQYKDSGGNTQTITMTLQSFNIQTNFQCSGIGEASTTATLPVSIVYPNGQTYSFQYESTPLLSGKYTGRISQVTLPTGGTYQYQYSQGVDCTTGYPLSMTRTITNGSSVATWNYSRSRTTQNNGQIVITTTTVTEPKLSYDSAANQRVVTFATNQSCISPYTTTNCTIETDQTYQGSSATGVLLQTVSTYTNPINGVTPYAQITTRGSSQSKVMLTYDGYGNLLTKNEYEWGTGAPGSLLRTTTNTYLNSSTYLNIGISNRLASTVIANGAGTTVAQTQYEYDNYTSGITASGAVQHNATYNTSYTTRGNITAVKRWRNTDGTWFTTRLQYDDAGNALSSTDPLSHSTTFSYADSWANTSCTPSGGNAAAYVTAATNSLTQKTTGKYNSCSGSTGSTTDPNNQTTSFTYDSMGRTTLASYPDQGQTSYSYTDTAPPSMTSTSKMNASQHIISTALFDNLGELKETQLTDPQGTVHTDTTYDVTGRAYSVSNPYRSMSDLTYGLTTYFYDALGRTTVVVPPDGTLPTSNTCASNDACITYSGNTTTTTDEAGISRKTVINGLGQLVQLVENPSGWAYQTNYTYDVLNDLTAVAQNGSRQRTYGFNSLSQLISSTDPESNTTPAGSTVATAYSYDADGNLSQKIAPAQNQTGTSTVTLTYCHDALNRQTAKGYTSQTCSNGIMPTPVATYWYDGTSPTSPSGCSTGVSSYGLAVGRKTAMCDAAGVESWVYNDVQNAGWQIIDKRTTNSVTASTTIQDNLAGLPTAVTYPSGRTITYTYDSAGRSSDAVDTTNSINYAVGSCTNGATSPSTGACYAPQGAVSQLQNGSNLVSTYQYNARLQPCWVYGTTGAALATNTACTAADPGPANILDLKYNVNLGIANNGNVRGITNNRDTTRSEAFAYDALNRILTGETTSTYSSSPSHCWGEAYVYDNQNSGGGSWGNLTNINVASTSYNGCTQESLSATANAQNRLSINGYDTAGNATSYGTSTYAYNAENQMTQSVVSSTTGYVFDGAGDRVEKTSGGQVTKIYWYGGSNNVLDETDGTGSFTNANFNEYVYFGGGRIARRNSSNIFYYLADQLGTSREIVQAGQTAPCYDADFYPFGGERPYTTTCTQNYKFTGQERDSESNLDNSQVRYRSSAVGRFMSPDPSGLSLANLADPQQLNLYSYVRDNPLSNTDPTGLDCVYLDDSGSHIQSVDPSYDTSGDECSAEGGYWIGGTVDASSTVFTDPNSNWIAVANTYGQIGVSCNNVGAGCDANPPLSLISLELGLPPAAMNEIFHRPWVLSWIIPIAPYPGLAGIGPAGDLEWNPDTHNACVGLGIGLSAGKNVAFGPLTNGKMFDGQTYPNGADDILGGWSLSGGYNSPAFIGVQGTVNGSGAAAGPSIGVPGASIAATDSACAKLW